MDEKARNQLPVYVVKNTYLYLLRTVFV